MWIFNLFRAIRKRWKFLSSIPKTKDCLLEKVTEQEALQKMRNFIEENLNAPEYYEKILSEHEEFIEKRWAPFMSKFKQGDELWYFSTPGEYWTNLCGRNGFAIIRNGKKINELIFCRS